MTSVDVHNDIDQRRLEPETQARDLMRYAWHAI